ncbi:MAG: hypothetical protein ACNS62_02770 [Candidatus Cyclobacteriaceae bacterium M3_2C_046]
MKKLTYLFLLTVLPLQLWANNGCEAKLVLSSKVYSDCSFKSETYTWLKKGQMVEVIDFKKGFCQILINQDTAYITESNLEISQNLRTFKYNKFDDQNYKARNKKYDPKYRELIKSEDDMTLSRLENK